MNELGTLSIQLTTSGTEKVVADFQTMGKKLGRLSSDIEKQREKDEKTATRIAEQENKRREMIVRNSSIMAGKYAEQQANKEISEAKRSAAERIALAKKVASGTVSALRGALGTVTRLMGSALAIGGGIGLANVVGNLITVQKMAAQVAVSSRVGLHPEQEVSADAALAKARDIAKKYGVEETETLGGLQAFIAKTGRGAKGFESMDYMAKIGMAEGVDVKELGAALGNAVAQNPNMSNKEMENLLRLLVGQGKIGAVEMADMVNVLPVAMAQAVAFSGNQFTNQAKLATFLQYGVLTTGNPEQAATAIKSFGIDIAERKKAWQQLGINPFVKEGGTTKLDDPFKLMREAIVATKGSLPALTKLFGRRAVPLAEAFIRPYQEAEAKKPGSGAEALDKELSDLATKAAIDEKAIERDRQTQLTSGKRIEMAWMKIRDGLEDKLAPVLERIASGLTPAFIDNIIDSLSKLVDAAVSLGSAFMKLLPAITAIVGFIADHPYLSAGAYLGAKMGPSILGPMIGMGGALGGAAAIATTLAIASAVLYIDSAELQASFAASDVAQNQAGYTNDLVMKQLNEGTLTPQSARALAKVKGDEIKNIKQQMSDTGGVMGYLFGGGITGDLGIGDNEQKAHLETLAEQLQKAQYDKEKLDKLGKQDDWAPPPSRDKEVASFMGPHAKAQADAFIAQIKPMNDFKQAITDAAIAAKKFADNAGGNHGAPGDKGGNDKPSGK